MVFQMLSGQTVISIDLQKSSYLAINGSTNIVSFKLLHNGEKFSNRNLTFTSIQNQNKVYLVQNKFSFAVKDFTSNNKMALKDFFKLLRSDTYPILQVQINYLEIQPDIKQKQFINGNTSVSITITGVTKEYSIPVSSTINGDLYEIAGKKTLSIRDFGLNPPTEMMGLIKVSEWIDINFHLVCKITTL